ncbi:homoserine and homoserine lactone efflux protein [alpha proteobacterium U9-1i]|nr:homoserine and homoserine lactone efflux protein [alpha proteobacterium U9-1i]
MIEPAALLAWTALALAATLSPGPDTLLVASHAARGGLRAGLAAAAGIVAGGFYYAALIGFGLLNVLVAIPALFLAVKIIGAIYLAWLGAGLIWNALRGKPETAPAKPIELSQPFMQAFLTNALNPKVALFYLAVLPQFASGPSAPAIGVLLIAIHYATAAIWMPCIAFAASRARKISWSRTFVRWLEGAIGVFFVAVAGRLVVAQR